MADSREQAAAEIERRTPAARRRIVRRLLAGPFERPALVSLPIDHVLMTAPLPRPPRRYLRAKVLLERWAARTTEGLGRAARTARAHLRDAWRARR